MTKKILEPGQGYTFSQYFQLSVAIEDILAEFDYSYATEKLELPKSENLPDSFEILQRTVERNAKLTALITEDARKQAIISPILFDLCDSYKTRLNIEYPIKFNEQLKGSLDYYIDNGQKLLVVEAKNADLTRGFTQLAVELIALDKLEDSDSKLIYGAVTIGNIWKFGFVDRKKKMIYEDAKLYLVPDELENLFKILLGILIN